MLSSPDKRERELRDLTMQEAQLALSKRDTPRAMGILLSMCTLPSKIQDLIEWLNKPYCGYGSESEMKVLERQIKELEEFIGFLPTVNNLAEQQLHMRKKGLDFLCRKELEESEAELED